MRVVSLGSGSSGNALFVEAGPQGRTRLLVDAGLGARTILQRLQAIGISPSQLSGILVTHEHSDHIQGIPILTKRYAVPVIADPRTLEAIEQFTDKFIEKAIKRRERRVAAGKIILHDDLSIVDETTEFAITVSETQQAPLDMDEPMHEENEATMLTALETSETDEATANVSDTTSLLVPFPVGSQHLFGDIEVTSFPTSHDAVAPCGYLLYGDGYHVCIATDTGMVTPETLKAMRHADLLILESNYNKERLLHGPYARSVKQRILSPTGHLSNAQAARAVLKAWSPKGTRWLWLAHLSRINNTPSLAIDHMRAHLQKAGVNLSQITITALPPDMGEVWDSTGLWYNLSLF